ncbi:MAG: DUF421 domain-containing protein [Candidatus Korobacteraceae bacterium]
MDVIFRAAVIYFGLLILLRITGNRALAQITVFDFILLLIISEAVQNGLVGEDYSLTNALLVVTTLVTIDIGLSFVKRKFPSLELYLEGCPTLLVDNGKLIRSHMEKSRVDEEDILESARKLRGLESLDQVKYAILERGGDITIIPRSAKP